MSPCLMCETYDTCHVPYLSTLLGQKVPTARGSVLVQLATLGPNMFGLTLSTSILFFFKIVMRMLCIKVGEESLVQSGQSPVQATYN
jgi:hypothetical protein